MAERSRRWHAAVLLAAGLWLAALGSAGAEAEHGLLDLPAPPDVAEALELDLAGLRAVAPDEPAPVTAIKIDIAPPQLPEVVLSFAPGPPETALAEAAPLGEPIHTAAIVPSAEPQAAPVAAERPRLEENHPEAPPRLELPALPPVIASIEVPTLPAASVTAPIASAPALPPLSVEEPRLRAFFEARRARLKLTNAMIESFAQSYAARAGAPLWLSAEGRVEPKAEALARLIATADRDGLDPARLQSVLPAAISGFPGENDRLDAELSLSLAAFLYAHDARGGRLEPSRLSANLTPTLSLPAPAEVLAKLASIEADGLATSLESYQPRHAGYRALRAELARFRAAAEAESVPTASLPDARSAALARLKPGYLDGPALILGRQDARVGALRLRLGLPESASGIVDAELITAIREFQRANELQVNGKLTPRTRAALENAATPLTRSAAPDPAAMTALILANMERWRWLPTDLGDTHIFVNVPDYRLEMVSEGAVIHETRVIVGKPETQTPIFSDEMEHLVVNPSWTVPPSILKNEFLPRLAVDPDYAARRGYEVIRRGNQITVRQPPGDANALGHIKFMFPNSHAVYLHDTPSRHLFANETRAYSHGCIRVEKPFLLAEHLLLKRQGIGEKQLRGMVGYGERTIRLVGKVPVHLAYFTVFVDENGQLQRRPDLYGHDQRLRRALAL